MSLKRITIMLFAASLLIAQPLFSQDITEDTPKLQEQESYESVQNMSAATPSEVIEETAIELETIQPEEMSIYGEVRSIDSAASCVKLQYYDYDSDEERSSDIVIDKDTKLENVAGLYDIKQGDWIDAVYVETNGKNVAKSVIVEKEEEEPVLEGQVTEEIPAEKPEAE